MRGNVTLNLMKRVQFSNISHAKTLRLVPVLWSVWLCSNDNKLTVFSVSVVMAAEGDGGESLAC